MTQQARPLPEAVRRSVEEYARRLRDRFGSEVAEVRLFGSHARGQAGEESDVDVAVVLNSVDWPTRREVIDLATDVGLERDLHLSPTLLDRKTFERWQLQERALITDILQEGVPL